MRKKLNTQFNTRQYMVSRDFEIYYYKDQHMKKVANHIHDYYEIYFFLEGDVSLEIEKKEYPLQYGDVAVVPPGLEHHAVIHDESVPYKRFVFWITVDYLNRLMEDAKENIFSITTESLLIRFRQKYFICWRKFIPIVLEKRRRFPCASAICFFI